MLKEFTVQGARNLSLLRFADPVTDSVSRKKEVQRKREPLGLKLKCDFGQKLQQAGVGVWVHLLGSLSPAARSSCLQVSVCMRACVRACVCACVCVCAFVCVAGEGCRFSIHRAWCEPAGEKGAV